MKKLFIIHILLAIPLLAWCDNITFADAEVKAICVGNWDTNGDGELSKAEAAAVKDLDEVFRNNTSVKSFDELQYFTGLTIIGNYAFRGCSSLLSVTIPNSVVSIGGFAFAYCYCLTSVAIPNSVTSIEYNAFRDCRSLASIIIPNSVTWIGGSAFYGCGSLTSITIPNSVTEIVQYAFANCSSLTSVTIPNSVTSIGQYAFEDCSSLTSVTIPNSVTEIGQGTFRGCSSLTSITIPTSVTSIGQYTFYGCSGLTSVTIPNSVTSIAQYTFCGCKSLTSITIPNSVTSIDQYAFIGCSSLASVTIPNSVTSIGEAAFYGCSGLTSITIPNSVTSVEGNAFNGCSNLTSITIPSSVTTIGYGAFSSCKGIASIKVDDNNIKYDSRDNCNAIIETATNTLVQGCKNTTIPNSVIAIGTRAFYGNVNHFTIPSWITYIGGNAFSCKMVEVESTVPIKIHESAFGNTQKSVLYVPKGCIEIYSQADCWNQFSKIVEQVSFEPIQFEDSNVKKICVSNWDLDGDGELSYNEAAVVDWIGQVFHGNQEIRSFKEFQYFTRMSMIPEDAFRNCGSLESIAIPNSVASIGWYAFAGCALKSVDIPNSVASIGHKAFYGCIYLESVTLPNALTSIESNLFAYCQRLKTVTIPESVTSIGTGAFLECTNLISLTIGNSVTTIGDGAFGNCYSLKTLTIPNSVTTIGGDAFARCKNLEFVDIPNSVTHLGDQVFDGCERLKSVHLPNSLKDIGTELFLNCPALAAITWDADMPMTNEMMGAVSNPNLLFYTRNNSYAPTGVNNVIVNGTAKEITLSDSVSSNNFYCPTEFTAERISYTHKYEMQSGLDGKAQGWETIALPFTVTAISHESKGKLLPFGAWTSTSDAKPFWLCKLSSSGFTHATSIEANTPYIICMPNNSDYDSSFNLSGNVTFSATNVKVPVSSSVNTVKSNGKSFVPAFSAQEKASGVYALNISNGYHSEVGDYTEGSAFVSGLRAVSPFEAYMTTNDSNAKRAFLIDFNETTGISDVPIGGSKDKIAVYNMGGQEVAIIDKAHFRELKNQLPTGMYIVDGKKLIIK